MLLLLLLLLLQLFLPKRVEQAELVDERTNNGVDESARRKEHEPDRFHNSLNFQRAGTSLHHVGFTLCTCFSFRFTSFVTLFVLLFVTRNHVLFFHSYLLFCFIQFFSAILIFVKTENIIYSFASDNYQRISISAKGNINALKQRI